MQQSNGTSKQVTAYDKLRAIECMREDAYLNEMSALGNARREERAKWQKIIAEKDAEHAKKMAEIEDKDAEIAGKKALIAELLARLGEGE